MNNTPKQSNAGFSLIELSVVIMILGIIITPLFGIITQNQKMEERRYEESVNQRVISALALYLKENGEYPCPADPTLAPGDANFGEGNCGTTQGLTGARTSAANAVRRGALPIKDLNLPIRAAININDWKYMYAVTQTLTDTATYDGLGDISIVDSADASFLAAGKFAHFVIINPGMDGKGSFTLRGGASATACNTALDAENCDNNAVFREAVIDISGDYNDGDYYDDVIAYSLALEESTMWMVRESPSTTGVLDLVNRNTGNIGIGTNTPDAGAKVHISGGNLRVENSGGGGEVRSNEVQSGIFYYK